LSPDQRAKGIIAYSGGNHAQGVAFVAREHGTSAVILMPRDAPRLKIANTRDFGAEVVLYDRDNDDRNAIGAQMAAERGLTLIKPYDDKQVIAGQGTVGLEIAEQAVELGVSKAAVLVPCSGGGLTTGVALALAAKAPDMVVHPVEPARFDDVTRSLVSGNREINSRRSGSICDTLLTPTAGEMLFPVLKKLCGRGYVVSDDDCLDAMAQAFFRLKLVAEPGGAAALAAALTQSDDITGDAIIVVISGGNVDSDMFQRALAKLG